MAHQCPVVGDMAAAGKGVVVAKLNVQAPVQPVLDLPMAAHRAHELLRIGSQAADVVAALDARFPPRVRVRSTRVKLFRWRH